ncbi:MAG: carotenoid oxygenase, partial [Variovorax sp.]|nr:carotenoid oxygenase [Variovorax sp.]
MERRELLRLLAAAGALPLFSPLARAAGTTDDNWQAQFEAADTPWKIGFATPPGDLPLTRATVRGRFPDAVAGTLFRVGPAG